MGGAGPLDYVRGMLLLLSLLACSEPLESLSCEAALSPTMTLLPQVRLSFAEPVQSWVEYAVPELPDERTDTIEGASVTHSLRGAYAQVEVEWTAWADDGRGPSAVCEGSIETGSLPMGLADLTVEVEAASDLEGPELMVASMGGGPFVAIFDRQGRIRWFVESDAGTLPIDVQLGQDGDRVRFNSFDPRFEEDIGLVRSVDLDGEVIEDVQTSLAHHVFAQHPDGTLAWLALDIREFTDPDSGETDEVVGDAIVERAPQGDELRIGTVWDWPDFEPDLDEPTLGLYPGMVDWTHGNALKRVDEGDSYLLSMANVDLVTRVDRATGQPIEHYGSRGFQVEEGSRALNHQHDPSLLEGDRLLVFNSVMDPAGSGASEYEIDREAGVLREVWSYGFGPDTFNPVLGQAIDLGEGRRIVNFGFLGSMHLVEADGTPSWVVQGPPGHAFRQMQPFPGFWPGR